MTTTASPGAAAGGAELLEELQEAGSVKFAGLQTEHKPPIPPAHGSEIPHTLAGGGVEQDRVLDFRRNPHAAARAMLLNVHFVGGPKIDAGILHQVLEFFLCAFCMAGFACASAGPGLRNRKPS
jgi:hypothetical protein